MISNKNIEILQNITEADYPIVGKSLSTLSRFAQEKLPVSNAFIVTTNGFNSFLELTDLKKYFQNAKKSADQSYSDLKNSFESLEFPHLLSNEISKAYSKISGFTDAFVNIRALIVNEDNHEINHRAFVLLDIRGLDTILRSIKLIYKEIIFDNSALVEKYLNNELKVVLLVQKAQQSESSGVMFTTDLISKDPDKLSIEAVYGLESIAEIGSIVPDQYIYSKSEDKVIEKYITTQEYMFVRQSGLESNNMEKVKISPVWQKRQKLDDKHIITLAKTGKIIEEGLQEPQQIIWSFETGKVWINFIESSKKVDIKKEDHPKLQELINEEILNSSPSFLDQIQDKATEESDIENTYAKEQESPTEKLKQEDLINIVIADDAIEPHIEQAPELAIDNIETNQQSEDVAIQEEEINIEIEEKAQAEEKINIQPNLENTETFSMSSISKTTTSQEPLLQGKHYFGNQTEGEICIDPVNCTERSILVLKGDEDISANLSVKGFIVEDESEILAKRMFEYFNVPVITGVPLARKILKPNEIVQMDGTTGSIYETVPFAEQLGEIEMNFVATKPETSPDIEEKADVEEKEEVKLNANVVSVDVNSSGVKIDQISIDDIEDTNEVETVKEKDDKKENNIEATIKEETSIEVNDKTADISSLLNLVSDDIDMTVKSDMSVPLDEVKGVSHDEQFNTWGRSLDKIINASKSMSAPLAAEALEHVLDDTTEIGQSKEVAFDDDEAYIATNLQLEEAKVKKVEYSEYVPTATKVYVHLIDEKLPKGLMNYDGVIFSSSYDMDLYLNMLKEVLNVCTEKEVLVICPPYETEALTKFLEETYFLRNQGHRNLSLILPDYRNKKELVDTKKVLSSIGLRRSSTFNIYGNISRTINVFRVEELDATLLDGAYIDLFRLKMNMLGVEKLKASTRYAEGIKNLVTYLSENIKFESKTIVNLTGFSNKKDILHHLASFKFWAVAASLSNVESLKKSISSIESKHIINAKPQAKKRIRRK